MKDDELRESPEKTVEHQEQLKNPKQAKEESYFLEGPHSRWKEFLFVWKVVRELFRGIRKLHFIGPCVSIFGSARFDESHPYYKQAVEMGAAVAGLGFVVMTGGGPGIMEAANRGAKEMGGKSVGCNIILPFEQNPNPYMDRWVNFKYFFVRKVLLFKYSYAFVIFPGGFGTMDECFEALTLIQTAKVENFPVIIMGTDYWQQLRDFFDHMIKVGTISAKDLDLCLFTDSVDEATAYLKEHAIKGFNLQRKTGPRPRPWLWEST